MRDQPGILPHTAPMTPAQAKGAYKMVAVFGKDVPRCMFSKEWKARVKALEHVQQIAVEAINALERERKEKDAQIRSLREQVQRREISRNFGRAR